MKNRIKNLIDEFFFLIRKTHFIIFNYKEYSILNKNIFITYTMGKVGSSSIESALKDRIFYNKIFHTHFLSSEGLKKHKEFNKTNSGYTLASKIELEIKKNPHKRIKYITLVRDPIARDISDLFENYYRYIPEQKEGGIDYTKMQQFFENFDHEYGLRWLDEELNVYLNIDIYNYPFEKSKGYQIIRTDKYDLLIFKLEKLKETFTEAMDEFTKIKDWSLKANVNTAEDKFYSDIYNKFKSEVEIKSDIKQKVYNSKFFNHFYSENEKEKMIGKWKR